MLGYLLRRSLGLLVVLAGILLITFVLVAAIPGDAAIYYAGPHATAASLAETRHTLGLDQPRIVQLGHYLGRLLQGDLGTSSSLDEPVRTAIGDRLPATIELAGAVIALELIVALIVGTLAASQEGGVLDRLLTGLSALGVSLPGFWIGLMLLYLVAFRLNLLPLGGDGSPLPEYLLLPAITQGVPWGFWYARILRATLLEIMGQDYLRTARSKGIGRRGVLIRHALPNAIGPVLTILAMDLGQLLGGIVVVETVFAWPGVGLQAAQALKNLDTPLVIGTLLLSGVAIAVLNLLADLVRGVLDPRIRLT